MHAVNYTSHLSAYGIFIMEPSIINNGDYESALASPKTKNSRLGHSRLGLLRLYSKQASPGNTVTALMFAALTPLADDIYQLPSRRLQTTSMQQSGMVQSNGEN